MNTITILYFWGVVACGSTQHMPCVAKVYEWRSLGEYRSVEACEKGAEALNLNPKVYRCVNTGKP